MVLLAATSWSLTSSDSSFDTCFPCFDSSGGRRHLWEGLLQVVPKVVRTLETSCNLLKHRTPINRAKLADMKDKKVPNLLTTDQKVGGSSPSKRTRPAKTSQLRGFLYLVGSTEPNQRQYPGELPGRISCSLGQ